MTDNIPAIRNDFPAMLEKFKGEIVRALPKHLSGDRMCRIALTEFRKNPKLAACDPKSVFAAVIQASQLGLEVGLMGEASLVPFGSECQLIPGYVGLMKLAMNTGKITDIYAHSVRENDSFEIVYGLERTMRHKPLMDRSFPADDSIRGEIVGYYAVAVFADGKKTFQAMSNSDVLKIRDSSKGYKASKKFGKVSTWDEHPEAMGIKTVIRRLCKYLPKSPELASALELDNITDTTGHQRITVDDAVNNTWTPDYAVDDKPETNGLKEKLMAKLTSGIKQPDQLPGAGNMVPDHIADVSNMIDQSVDANNMAPDQTAEVIEMIPTPQPIAGTDTWADFREGFINLKSSGFSTFVYKHLEKFKDANIPARTLAEAKYKWDKLYPGQAWPGTKPETTPAVAAPPVNYLPEYKGQKDRVPEIPVSYSPEYKSLKDLKEQFPEYYAQAKTELNIYPETVVNCQNLTARINQLIEATIDPHESAPSFTEAAFEHPPSTDTSGF
jgi:recombination protein RecT